MASTRNIISTESAGAQEGQDFNDKSIVPKIHKAVIKRILLGHDHIIRSIMVSTHFKSYVPPAKRLSLGGLWYSRAYQAWSNRVSGWGGSP